MRDMQANSEAKEPREGETAANKDQAAADGDPETSFPDTLRLLLQESLVAVEGESRQAGEEEEEEGRQEPGGPSSSRVRRSSSPWRLGLAIGIQAVLVKPFRIPSPSMVPTLEVGSACWSIASATHFGDPSRGDVVVFKPPSGADSHQCGIPSQPADGHPCSKPTATKSESNFIKRVVGLPGDTLADRKNNRVPRSTGKQIKEPYIQPGTSPATNSAICRNPIKVPPGHFFMMGDNRGESDDSRDWGPVPKKWVIGRAFFTYWPPRGSGRSKKIFLLSAIARRRHRWLLRLAHAPRMQTAQADDRPQAVRVRPRASPRFVAGADEAGRGCLAGPARGGRRPLRHRTAHARRSARAGASTTRSSTTTGGARAALPARAARRARVAWSRCVRGIDTRGLHITNLEALRDTVTRVASPDTFCLVDGFRVGRSGPSSRRSSTATRSSAAIAAASVLAKVTRDRLHAPHARADPGWEFESNVGYSTPEHRAAIAEIGIRRCTGSRSQSIAYQQLALG